MVTFRRCLSTLCLSSRLDDLSSPVQILAARETYPFAALCISNISRLSQPMRRPSLDPPHRRRPDRQASVDRGSVVESSPTPVVRDGRQAGRCCCPCPRVRPTGHQVPKSRSTAIIYGPEYTRRTTRTTPQKGLGLKRSFHSRILVGMERLQRSSPRPLYRSRMRVRRLALESEPWIPSLGDFALTNDALVLLASVVVYLHCSLPPSVDPRIPLLRPNPVLLAVSDVIVVGVDAPGIIRWKIGLGSRQSFRS